MRKTRKFLTIFLSVIVAMAAVFVLYPATNANAGTNYFYYTTDPNAGPIVMNGIVYYPSNYIPAGVQTVTMYNNYTPLQQPTQVCPQQYYPQYPQQDILAPVQPVQPNYQKPKVQKLNMPQVQTQPRPSTPIESPTIEENYNGINSEAEKLTWDMMAYAQERFWNSNSSIVADADYYRTVRMTFSNAKALIYVDQQTVLKSANTYHTYWWVNGVPCSQSTAKQLISQWCVRPY